MKVKQVKCFLPYLKNSFLEIKIFEYKKYFIRVILKMEFWSGNCRCLLKI